MTIWNGVRPLRIEIHGQPERQRYWAEVELGGMQARRVVIDTPGAQGLEAMLRKVHEQFEAWEPIEKAPLATDPMVIGRVTTGTDGGDVLDAITAQIGLTAAPRRRGRPPKARVAKNDVDATVADDEPRHDD